MIISGFTDAHAFQFGQRFASKPQMELAKFRKKMDARLRAMFAHIFIRLCCRLLSSFLLQSGWWLCESEIWLPVRFGAAALRAGALVWWAAKARNMWRPVGGWRCHCWISHNGCGNKWLPERSQTVSFERTYVSQIDDDDNDNDNISGQTGIVCALRWAAAMAATAATAFVQSAPKANVDLPESLHLDLASLYLDPTNVSSGSRSQVRSRYNHLRAHLCS